MDFGFCVENGEVFEDVLVLFNMCVKKDLFIVIII